MIPEKLYSIIGYPLGHTMSPTLHNWGFALEKIAATYMAFPIPPDQLGDYVTAVRTLPVSGASVTIPHKETIIPLLDGITPRAQAVGAVNTLFWEDGRLMGENTDVTGFLAPLRVMAAQKAEEAPLFSSALLLGAGGAAKAVLAGLQELRVKRIYISNRNYERAAILAERFGVTVIPWEERASVAAELIVNSTPLGMSGDAVDMTPFSAVDFGANSVCGVAYDLVYNPLRTLFLSEASAAGWETLDGLHMFAEQGIEQFRIWTGKSLDVVAVRELIAKALKL